MSADESYDILIETNRFSFTHAKAGDRYGRDAALWLSEKMKEAGLEAGDPGQEDWGWFVDVHYRDEIYLVVITGEVNKHAKIPDFGEWRFSIMKHRSFKDKMMGRNAIDGGDPIITLFRRIISKEKDLIVTGVEEN